VSVSAAVIGNIEQSAALAAYGRRSRHPSWNQSRLEHAWRSCSKLEKHEGR